MRNVHNDLLNFVSNLEVSKKKKKSIKKTIFPIHRVKKRSDRTINRRIIECKNNASETSDSILLCQS